MADSKTIEMIAKDTSESKMFSSVHSLPLLQLERQETVKTAAKAKPKVLLADVYVACVVKSFTNLDLAAGSFLLNFTFVCYIRPPQFDFFNKEMVNYLATHMKLRLDDKAGEPLVDPILGEWEYEGVKFIKFTVRRSETVLIPVEQQLAAVRNYPFDKFELHIRFEFESVWVPEALRTDNGPPVRVRFLVNRPKELKNGFHRGTRNREAVDRLPEYQIDFFGRKAWGGDVDKDNSQPTVTYSVEVARISLNVVWTTFFPMFATQALLVLLHTVESNISVGDMATIMLALFAFLTSARDKIPVFPQASVLDKMVFVFVIQLIFVCVDVLYEYFFPEFSARDRPIFLLISTVGFSLQVLYVAFRWFRSGLTSRENYQQLEKGHDTRTHEFDPNAWQAAGPRDDLGLNFKRTASTKQT
jgi:hypothetical protein